MKYLIFLVCTSFLVNSVMIKQEEHNFSGVQVNYPVRFVYIDRINQWWPPEKIAAGIGVPGYASNTIYNYVAFAFWSYASGPLDIVSIWADPVKYFGADSPFGNTKDTIQKTLKKKYNDGGVKVMISAFGATQFPTTAKYDPVAVATKLGAFVQQNNLDGVDIDWEDNAAMEAGTGQQWIIAFHKKLRQLLPNHIITHAPQGPYFKKQFYKNGGYVTVHQQVGSTIDFYNVQFYNQGDTKYDSYEGLFLASGGFFTGTAVKQIVSRGIPSKKIIVGKPVTPTDATNTGWMDLKILGQATSRAYSQMKWYGGVMFWQYPSDLSGDGIRNAVGHLKQMCQQNQNCK